MEKVGRGTHDVEAIPNAQDKTHNIIVGGQTNRGGCRDDVGGVDPLERDAVNVEGPRNEDESGWEGLEKDRSLSLELA